MPAENLLFQCKTRLQLAELLLEHYPNEKKEALDFAIKEFQEMKMKPSLEELYGTRTYLKRNFKIQSTKDKRNSK